MHYSTTNEPSCRICDAGTGMEKAKVAGHEMYCFSMSLDGRIIVSGGGNWFSKHGADATIRRGFDFLVTYLTYIFHSFIHSQYFNI